MGRMWVALGSHVGGPLHPSIWLVTSSVVALGWLGGTPFGSRLDRLGKPRKEFSRRLKPQGCEASGGEPNQLVEPQDVVDLNEQSWPLFLTCHTNLVMCPHEFDPHIGSGPFDLETPHYGIIRSN